jgi:hypothetical protein
MLVSTFTLYWMLFSPQIFWVPEPQIPEFNDIEILNWQYEFDTGCTIQGPDDECSKRGVNQI